MKCTRILFACLVMLLPSGKVMQEAKSAAPMQKPSYTASYGGRTGRGGVPWELDRFIVYTIRAAQRDVHDTNLDGKVNCIDYTLMFKTIWDKSYKNMPYKCEIVRNKHGSVMHHLFIGIRYDGKIVLVEPWASDPEMYFMEDNWNNWKYNPRYNIYGETARWMGEFKR